MTSPDHNASPEHLDATYSKFCTSMTEVGEENAMHFLCRFALLAMVRHPDGATLEKIIEDASHGLVDA